MKYSSTDDAIIFQNQEVGHRGVGECLLLGISASIVALYGLRGTYRSGYSRCACTTVEKRVSIDCNWTGLLDSQNGNLGLLARTVTPMQRRAIDGSECQTSTENAQSFDLHGEVVS